MNSLQKRSLLTLAALISALGTAFPQEPKSPYGPTAGEGGTIQTGAGSLDILERNAGKSVTDLVVPGAVIPFTYTRIWNSRGQGNPYGSASRSNWQWGIESHESLMQGDDVPTGNDWFFGYNITFPDGRVVQLGKPASTVPNQSSPPGAPGTYRSRPAGVFEYLVIDPDRAHAHFYLKDGSVVTWYMVCYSTGGCGFGLDNVVDPHGLKVTYATDATGTTITEPGGRWIKVGALQGNGTNTQTTVVSTSLGQSVTYTHNYNVSGTYPGRGGELDNPNVIKATANVTYNNVIDPTTGAAVQAQYIYKQVQPLKSGPGSNNPSVPEPTPFYRMVWASDPMFEGPLQQVKYVYDDSDYGGGATLNMMREERYSWDYYQDPGVMVARLETPPYTCDPRSGCTQGYWERKQIRGDGATRTISYFNPNAVHNWVDSQSNAHYEFGNGQNRPDRITDYDNPNLVERYEYETNTMVKEPIKITDMRGKVTLQSFEPVLGNLTRRTYPGGASKSWTYTDPARPFYLATITDERGKQTIYTRDPAKHLVTNVNYPDGANEGFTYNGFNQVLTHTLTSGGMEVFAYDGRGLKKSYYPPATASDSNPASHQTLYGYYSGDPLPSRNDRLKTQTDPRSFVTTYDYNARGQVVRVTHPDNSYTQSTYNMATGTLKWSADENHPGADTDPNQRTRYTYDAYKRVLTVKNPMGETTTNDYALDWVNPLVHTTSNPKFIQTPSGKTIIFDYDPNFRKIDQVSALGTSDEAWTLYSYDAVGNMISTTDPRGKITKFGYDDRNRKISSTNPLNQTTRLDYDAAGNMTKETRADNAFRSWDHDAMNRMWHAYDWRTSDPATAAQTTTYERTDLARNVTRIIDGKGAAYGYGYDELKRKTSASYPLDATGVQRTETWLYDSAGNMNLYKNPANQYKHLEYDGRNRARRSYWNGSNVRATATTPVWSTGPETKTELDAASRVTQVQTNNGETNVTYGYDNANRKRDEWQRVAGVTHHIGLEYDLDGRRFRMRTDLHNVGYRYNPRGELVGLGDASGASVFEWMNFDRDLNGNVNNRHTWTGSDQHFAYDDLNRPTVIESAFPAGVFARSWYQYDNVGREAQTWRDEQGSRGEQFQYTVSNQLQSAVYNALGVWNGGTPSGWSGRTDYSYTPDKLNRAGTNPSGVNQATLVGGQGMSYDGNFNLTAFKAWGGWTYSYDAQNQLKSAGSNTVQCIYDGLGRCLKRTINGVSTILVYDEWSVVNEFTGANAAICWNLFGPSGPDDIQMRVGDVGGGGIQFYHKDRAGSVTSITDTGTSVREMYRYDAFGAPTISDWGGANVRSGSNCNNRFMFTGREFFAQMGVYDYRHRWYHPALGRFLQTDPKGFDAGDMNLFRYCADDPVDNTDPMGLMVSMGRAELLPGVWDVTNDSGLHLGTDGSIGGHLPPAGASEPGKTYGSGPAAAAKAKVNWKDTGTETARDFVRSDSGKSIGGRTYPELNISASSDAYGKLDTLHVEEKTDIMYARKYDRGWPMGSRDLTAGEQQRIRALEPQHRNEIRGWGMDTGRDIAEKVAKQYFGRSALSAAQAARAALDPSFHQAVQASHNEHDLGPFANHNY